MCFFLSAQIVDLFCCGIEDLALCSFTPSQRNLKDCSKKDDDSIMNLFNKKKIIHNLKKAECIPQL